MSNTYRIVFPQGDLTRLSIVEIYDSYDVNELRLASRLEFNTEDQCYLYMVKLAKKHNLDYVPQSGYHDYLD